MKICFWSWVTVILLTAIFKVEAASSSANTVLADTVDAGGNADSSLPILSVDGRYVLFASTAKNLTTNAVNGVMPRLNVYLRDRILGNTQLVSINAAANGGGDQNSFPADISADGRFVLFESASSNLVAGDTNYVSDVFLRDTVAGVTVLVSTNAIPTYGYLLPSATYNMAAFARYGFRHSTMTPDGRYIAFTGTTNVGSLPAALTFDNIFVRDMRTGVTVCATSNSVSANAPVSGSDLPDISTNGQYVAFYSTATNVVPGVTNISEIYVYNLSQNTTTWVSRYAHTYTTLFGSNPIVSYSPVISEDGQYVIYASTLQSNTKFSVIFRYNNNTGVTDVVTTNAMGEILGNELFHRGLDISSDGRFVVYAANAGTGSAIYSWDGLTQTTTLVSGDLNNLVPLNSISQGAVSDASGRYVAFASTASGLVTNNTVGYNLYLRDLIAGTTRLLNTDSNNVGLNLNLLSPLRISTNGAVIAFDALSGSLMTSSNIYNIKIANTASNTLELASPGLMNGSKGIPNNDNYLFTSSLSTNGHYLAFASDASNLVTNQSSLGYRDIFLRDLVAGTNSLVTIDFNGIYSGNGFSSELAISGNGQRIVFSSFATNLVVGDTNKCQDVFVRDIPPASTLLISVDPSGTVPGNAPSYMPTISQDGRYVLFHSLATNLAAGISSTNYENVYLRDTATGHTKVLTTNTAGIAPAAAMTPDGHYTVFTSSTLPAVSLWDSISNRFTTITNVAASNLVAISVSGSKIAYQSGTNLYFKDLTTNFSVNLGGVGGASFIYRSALQFSADGHYLVHPGVDGYGQRLVYVYDSVGNSNLLVSSGSDSPAISPDGRFIAFRSYSTNLAANDTNGFADIFLYDQTSNTTTLVTKSVYGNTTAAGPSSTPVFSADSRTLFFQSSAGDLSTSSYNFCNDVFAVQLYSSSFMAFPISIAISGSQGAIVSWPTNASLNYTVQFANRLPTPSWQNLNLPIVANGASNQVLDSSAVNSSNRFYRVLGQPAN